MTEEICIHCGASLKSYWHRLTPGLVNTLVKVFVKVIDKGQDRVHISEITLNHSEYGNFQKLRFHGLIAKFKENGVWVPGDWLVTKRGAEFLRGEIRVPERVKTFRNKVIGHSDEVVWVKDILKCEPFFEQKFAFEFFDIPPETDYTDGILIPKHSLKKGILRCPKCEDLLVKKFYSDPGSTPNSVFVTRTLECRRCDYKEVLV
jgi:hypothetical protein